jgi:predicted O-methyltransferase YrrM
LGLLQPVVFCQFLQISLRAYCQEVLLRLGILLLTLMSIFVAFLSVKTLHNWLSLVFWSSITFGVAALAVLVFGLNKSKRDALLRLGTGAFFRYLAEKFRETRAMARTRMRERIFRRALREISSLAPGELPSRRDMQQLWYGWGNENYSGHPEYLEEVIRRCATVSDPVLECGSGLTTIVMGLFAGRRGIQVWTLEHDPEWYEHIAAALRRFRIEGVELVFAPLRDYGDYSWYDVPMERMPERFGMIVCDGPPQRTTPGDRYGLLPVMREHLGPGSVILLDDVLPHGRDPILSRWLQETRAVYQMVASRTSDSYAVVLLR